MDRKIASTILREFSNTTHAYYGSYAFAAGYMEQRLLSMLENMKPSEIMAVLADFEKTTKEYQQRQVVDTIKQ